MRLQKYLLAAVVVLTVSCREKTTETGELKPYKADTSDISLLKPSVDSVKIKELSKKFTIEKDEFNPDELVFYKPKSAPKYVNTNGIYCYFTTKKEKPGIFRFTVQYYADDWLFIKYAYFLIDGKSYEYFPENTKTDHADGSIWEWFDDRITSKDLPMLRALASCTSAKMKLVGSEYYKIVPIKKEQIKAIKETLEYYEALGGEWEDSY